MVCPGTEIANILGNLDLWNYTACKFATLVIKKLFQIGGDLPSRM